MNIAPRSTENYALPGSCSLHVLCRLAATFCGLVVLVTPLQVLGQQKGTDALTVCVLPFGNRDESAGSEWCSLALADLFADVLVQAPGVIVLDRHSINNVLTEQSLWGTGLIQERWAQSTGLVGRADIVLYGSFLAEGTNLNVEVHAMDVASRRMSAVAVYSSAQQGVTSWIVKATCDLVKQLRQSGSAVEVMKRAIPRRSLPSLERFYLGIIACEAGDKHRAATHLLRAVPSDPSSLRLHYWLGRTFESWKMKDHALLHYATMAECPTKDTTMSEETRDAIYRLKDATLTNVSYKVFANLLRADPNWCTGMESYLAHTGELPPGITFINYLPVTNVVTYSIFPSSTSSVYTLAIPHPTEYLMYEFLDGHPLLKTIKTNLKDGIFQKTYPLFIFSAPPGYLITDIDFKQRLEHGWRAASLTDYSHCVGWGTVCCDDFRRAHGHRNCRHSNFHTNGRLFRPYKAVFVTAANESVPADVRFTMVPEKAVVRAEIDTVPESGAQMWSDRYTLYPTPFVAHVFPGQVPLRVQSMWTEEGVDPTNNQPCVVSHWGRCDVTINRSAGETYRATLPIVSTSRKYKPKVVPRMEDERAKELAAKYVTSHKIWTAQRRKVESAPMEVSMVQPFEDTLVVCWQSGLEPMMCGRPGEVLLAVCRDNFSDVDVRCVPMPEAQPVSGLALYCSGNPPRYLLSYETRSGKNENVRKCIKSTDLRTWTPCLPPTETSVIERINRTATAAKMWEVPISPSSGWGISDYDASFRGAVYLSMLSVDLTWASITVHRAERELHVIKERQRAAKQEAEDLAKNRTCVEESRLAAKIGKEKGTGSAEFAAAVKKAVGGFRQVPVYTKPGEGTFQTYSLNDVRQGVDGFRFRMPREPGLDFAWLFAIPRGVTWYIVPIDGSLKNGFSHFQYFSGEFKDFSVAQDWLPIVQTLSGDNLEPGKEYAIWFQFADLDRKMVPAGLAAIPDPMNYTCKDTIEGVEVSFKRGQALAYVAGFQPPVTNAQTLLDYAVKRQDITMVKTALERGAQYAKSPFTLLVAAKTKNVKLLQELLKTGLQKQTWHVKSSQTAGLWLPEDTETGMVSALFLGDIGPEMIEFLARECGADVGLVVKTRFYGTCTALDYAARMGSAEECAKLIELGAKVSDYTIKMAKDHGMTDKIQLLEKARTK